MHAGQLTKQVTIQVRTLDQDASGQPTETWATFAVVYARIAPLTGKDYLSAKQVVDDVTHDVDIRYRRGIKPKMRVLYQDRIFEILSALDPKEAREWWYMKCKELIEDV